jgi:hypothetical protein
MNTTATSTYRPKDTLAVVKNGTSQIVSFYRRAKEYGLSSAEFWALCTTVINNSRLPQWAQCQLTGARDALVELAYRQDLVFAYDFNGQRYATDSEEYKKLSPMEVAENATFSGHVWRHDLDKVWYS